MLKNLLKDQKVFIVFFLLFLAAATYINFTTYRPKALAEVPEVRNYKQKNNNVFSIPYPMDTEKISDNKTADTRQVTLQTTQPEQKMREFYNIVLTSDGWEIETENEGKVFYTTKYKKGGNFITISTSKQKEDSDITIVSIEIQKYN